ncbi:hypothetical protein OR1_02219 [Geobacter sp. OR-1]|uniref:hypothetical protein n=1 Tax=Geobacter sp. OR-1 TaxID=1266765 RepID=UPI000543C208|nr:hypothetical protein [Geobacter sp. OR-1]GAM09935.1 hypothetical protein OR1_02219 [Geobacter sp. OR-1]
MKNPTGTKQKEHKAVELKMHRDMVSIERLRLELTYSESVPPSLHYNQADYTLAIDKGLKPEVLYLLLQLHPVVALEQRGKLNVVCGKRIFELEAFLLPPTQKIHVLILDKHTSAEQLALLRYMDIVVGPLLLRTETSAAEIYQRVDQPGIRKQVWQPPLDEGKSAFARAIHVTPAALSSFSSGKQGKKEAAQVEVAPVKKNEPSD